MAIEQKKGAKTDIAPADAKLEARSAFLSETLAELKKTTWPTKQEANRLTGVVLGVIVSVALFMGVLDAFLSFIVHKFSLIK